MPCLHLVGCSAYTPAFNALSRMLPANCWQCSLSEAFSAGVRAAKLAHHLSSLHRNSATGQLIHTSAAVPVCRHGTRPSCIAHSTKPLAKRKLVLNRATSKASWLLAPAFSRSQLLRQLASVSPAALPPQAHSRLLHSSRPSRAIGRMPQQLPSSQAPTQTWHQG